jgi:hypothetical protein
MRSKAKKSLVPSTPVLIVIAVVSGVIAVGLNAVPYIQTWRAYGCVGQSLDQPLSSTCQQLLDNSNGRTLHDIALGLLTWVCGAICATAIVLFISKKK